LLSHWGETDAAARVTTAAEADLATRGATQRSTAEIGDAIAALVSHA